MWICLCAHVCFLCMSVWMFLFFLPKCLSVFSCVLQFYTTCLFLYQYFLLLHYSIMCLFIHISLSLFFLFDIMFSNMKLYLYIYLYMNRCIYQYIFFLLYICIHIFIFIDVCFCVIIILYFWVYKSISLFLYFLSECDS